MEDLCLLTLLWMLLYDGAEKEICLDFNEAAVGIGLFSWQNI